MIKGGQDGQGLSKIVNDGLCCSEVRNGEGSSRMVNDAHRYSRMVRDSQGC